MKEKRKSRNKMSKEIDLLFPIPFDKLGSESDPCFGKLYKPSNPICQRCGDSEICASVMAQKNHGKRDKIESKTKFKDIEEQDPVVTKEIRGLVKARLKEMIKATKKIDRTKLVYDTHVIFFDRGYTIKKVNKVLDRLIEKSKHIKEKENNILWK